MKIEQLPKNVEELTQYICAASGGTGNRVLDLLFYNLPHAKRDLPQNHALVDAWIELHWDWLNVSVEATSYDLPKLMIFGYQWHVKQNYYRVKGKA